MHSIYDCKHETETEVCFDKKELLEYLKKTKAGNKTTSRYESFKPTEQPNPQLPSATDVSGSVEPETLSDEICENCGHSEGAHYGHRIGERKETKIHCEGDAPHDYLCKCKGFKPKSQSQPLSDDELGTQYEEFLYEEKDSILKHNNAAIRLARWAFEKGRLGR